jgi:hypothetical protein
MGRLTTVLKYSLARSVAVSGLMPAMHYGLLGGFCPTIYPWPRQMDA